MTADRELPLDLFGPPASPAIVVRFGRRVFLPSASRARIVELRSAGASLEAIAGELGIAVETLRSRFGAELERGLPGGRRPGRPTWEPTAEARASIAQLAADGLTQEQIAAALGVTAPTLRRACTAELATAGRLRRAGERRSS